MNTYRTSEVAEKIGIHPNTVRLYEELGLIPRPQRQGNGYRVLPICMWNSSVLPGLLFKLR